MTDLRLTPSAFLDPTPWIPDDVDLSEYDDPIDWTYYASVVVDSIMLPVWRGAWTPDNGTTHHRHQADAMRAVADMLDHWAHLLAPMVDPLTYLVVDPSTITPQGFTPDQVDALRRQGGRR